MSDLCYPDDTNWGAFPLPDDPTDLQADMKIMAEQFAWGTLQTLTGFRLAICPITVRPCHHAERFGTYYSGPWSALDPAGVTPFFPTRMADGNWINIVCGSGECDATAEIELPGPVGAVQDVAVNGIILDADAYRIDNGNLLVRQDGNLWPTRQNMNLPAGEEDTFTVTYYKGIAPDSMVLWAAGILAIEFYRSMTGDRTCRLPSGTRSVSRQGVTYEIQQNLFQNGFTGIPEVDPVIRRFNPNGLRLPSSVFSIDSMNREPRRTTAYGPGTEDFGFGQGGFGQGGFGR